MDWRLLAAVAIGLFIGMFIFGRSSKVDDKMRPQKPITQNILDYTATLGLILGMLFWGTYYYMQIMPGSVGWPLNVALWCITLLLGILHSMTGPLLVSLTMPQDPVNQLLSDQKKHTWGWMVQAISTVVMSVVSFVLCVRFFGVIPGVAESQAQGWLAVATTIFTIVIPNLAWQKAVPLNWQWQVQQAFAIEIMRKKHGAELIRMTAEHIRQISYIITDNAQMTVDNVPRVAHDYAKFMGAMFGRVNGEMRGLGQLVGALARAEGVRVPELDDSAVRKDLLALEDTMKKGLELGVIDAPLAGVPINGDGHVSVR